MSWDWKKAMSINNDALGADAASGANGKGSGG